MKLFDVEGKNNDSFTIIFCLLPIESEWMKNVYNRRGGERVRGDFMRSWENSAENSVENSYCRQSDWCDYRILFQLIQSTLTWTAYSVFTFSQSQIAYNAISHPLSVFLCLRLSDLSQIATLQFCVWNMCTKQNRDDIFNYSRKCTISKQIVLNENYIAVEMQFWRICPCWFCNIIWQGTKEDREWRIQRAGEESRPAHWLSHK